MDAQQDAVMQASALLRTYLLALHERGSEIIELLDARVPHARIAALYPNEGPEWQAGLMRLTRGEPVLRHVIQFDGTREDRIAPKVLRPSALTAEGWLLIHRALRTFSPESPYLSTLQRETYRRMGRVINSQISPESHIYWLIMLLYVLATAPVAADELQDSKVLRDAHALLRAAEALTHDPLFPRS